MRQEIYNIISKAEKGDKLSKAYNIFISLIAVLSIFPLGFRVVPNYMFIIENITVYILLFDYVLRWITCDYTLGKKPSSFVKYPFTPIAAIELISILPSIGLLPAAFKILRPLRVVKILHYSKSLIIISNVFRKQRKILLSVLYVALAYIFISALLMFAIEPQSFKNYFESLYWATTAITTVGYGDVCPTTEAGRLISMVSSLVGIAIIALPSGIVTGGFIDEMQRKHEKAKEQEKQNIVYKHNYNKIFKYILALLICSVLNEVLYLLANFLNLPMWLDTTGTVLAAVVLEPAAGVIVGLINNFSLSVIAYGSSEIVYFLTSATIAVLAGFLCRKNGKLKLSLLPKAAAFTWFGSSLVNSLILIFKSHGLPAKSSEILIYNKFISLNLPYFFATFISVGAIKILDILLAFLITFAVIVFLKNSKRFNNYI